MNRRLFSDAIKEASSEGFIADLRHITGEVYTGVVNEQIGSTALCRELARTLPGTGFPARGKGGCTWTVGSLQWGTLLHPHNLPYVYEAQGIAESVIGPEWVTRWTMGSIARSILQWVKPGKQDELHTHDAERLLKGIAYGYHECSPGLYPEVEFHDVQAYYYSMLKRIKSLRVYVGPKRLEWLETPGDEWERFNRVMSEVGRCKPLRNQLAGNMAGATRDTEGVPAVMVFKRKTDGKVVVKPLPYMPGRFRAIGLLMVRTGYEITALQCARLAEGCVYSNIDCVFSRAGSPDVWTEYGFRTELKAVGPAEVCGRGCYKVGNKQTIPYKKGYREIIPVSRPKLPKVLYGVQWL